MSSLFLPSRTSSTRSRTRPCSRSTRLASERRLSSSTPRSEVGPVLLLFTLNILTVRFRRWRPGTPRARLQVVRFRDPGGVRRLRGEHLGQGLVVQDVWYRSTCKVRAQGVSLDSLAAPLAHASHRQVPAGCGSSGSAAIGRRRSKLGGGTTSSRSTSSPTAPSSLAGKLLDLNTADCD